MKAKVATLVGLTENPTLSIDILLSNYFKALKSTSTVIPKEIRSFIYDVNTAKHKDNIISNIETSLGSIFNAYFNDFKVDVDVITVDNKHEITLKVIVKDNGETINVGKLVGVTGTRIDKLKDISNLGAR